MMPALVAVLVSTLVTAVLHSPSEALATSQSVCKWSAQHSTTNPHGQMNDVADKAHEQVLFGNDPQASPLEDEPACQLDDHYARELLQASSDIGYELFVARTRHEQLCAPLSSEGADACLGVSKENDGTPTCVFADGLCALSPLISMRAMGWRPRQEVHGEAGEEFGHGVFIQKVIRCNLLAGSAAVCANDEHCEFDPFSTTCVPKRESVSEAVEAIGSGAAKGLFNFAKTAAECSWSVTEEACERIGHCWWAGMFDGGCQLDMAGVLSNALSTPNSSTAPLVELDSIDKTCDEAGLYGQEECVKNPNCDWDDSAMDMYYGEQVGGCFVDGAAVARSIFLRDHETPLFTLFDSADDCFGFRSADACGEHSNQMCTWVADAALRSSSATVKPNVEGGYCAVGEKYVRDVAIDDPCPNAYRALSTLLHQSSRCRAATTESVCSSLKRPLQLGDTCPLSVYYEEENNGQESENAASAKTVGVPRSHTSSSSHPTHEHVVEAMSGPDVTIQAEEFGAALTTDQNEDMNAADDDVTTTKASSPIVALYILAAIAAMAVVAGAGFAVVVRNRNIARARADEWVRAELI